MKTPVLLERPLTAREARKALRRQGEALVGFEFEFAVPDGSSLYTGDDGGDAMELRRLSDIGDLFDYFEHLGISRMARRMEIEYEQWVETQQDEWVDNNWDSYEDDSIEDDDDREAEAREEARAKVDDKIDTSFEAYIDAEHGNWRGLIDNYDLVPKYGWQNDTGNDRATFFVSEVEGSTDKTREAVADALSRYLGVKVRSSDTPNYDHWKVVPDGSITGGHDAEIVSPPMQWADAITAFQQIARFASKFDLETNPSTGLHINVSVPDIKNIDIVKFIVFLGDEFALEVFKRSNNIHTVSQAARMVTGMANAIKMNNWIDESPEFDKLRQMAYSGLSSHKYNTVNISKLVNYGYLEIRIAGGDYLTKAQEVMALMNRIIVTLDIAMDPQSDRNLYIKKLTKLLDRAKWHVNPSNATTPEGRQYLHSLFSKSPDAYKIYRRLSSEELKQDEALVLASTLVYGLAKAIRTAGLPRLSFAQAAELLKLFKKHQISIASISNVDADTAHDLKTLGLAK